MQVLRLLFVAAVCVVSMGAQAQWQWVDNAGRKFFSDQPPPPGIPLKNIVKQPSRVAAGPAAAPTAAASAPTALSAAASAAVPQLPNDDPELLARKKKADAEALARNKAAVDAQTRIKAANCENAKANQALLNSGVRIAVTNAKGEREFLDDAARAAEQRRVRSALETSCG